MDGSVPPPAWFREWAERTGHVFFVVRDDADWSFEFVSESVVALTGHTAAELLADPHVLVTQVMAQEARARIAADFDADGHLSIEVDLRHSDGHIVQARVTANRRTRAADGARVIEGIAYDVSEVHTALQRADQSEAWFRLSFEKSLIAMCVVGPDGRFLLCNPALCQMLGRDEDELSGMTWLEVTFPADVQADLDLVTKVLQGDSTGFRLLKRFVAKDGRIIWGDLTTAVLYDSTGEPLVWISQIVDVTGRIEAEEALALRDEELTDLADEASAFVMRIDAEGVVQSVSDTIAGVLGWRPEQIVGSSAAALIPSDGPGGLSWGDAHGRCRVLRADGAALWMDVAGRPILGTDGEVVSAVISWRDVQAQVAAEQALAASEEKFRLLAENVTDVVLHLDAGVVKWVSPSLQKTLGWAPQDWIGRAVGEFHHPDDRARVAGFQERLSAGEEVVARVRVLSADGTYHWVSGHSAAYRAPTAGPAESVVSIRIVDADVAWEQELDRRANYDELTDLLTRRALFDSFAVLQERALAANPPSLAALFCDLDDFKRINDTYGHAFGDDVLRAIAKRILGVTRQGDLVARMGGDEVLIVLHSTANLAEAEAIAERIGAALAEPIPTVHGEVQVTASIGVAMVRPGESADDLISRADAAMYRAKRVRRGGVVTFN